MTLPFLDMHVEAALGPYDTVPFPPFPAKHIAVAPIRVRRIKLGMQRRRSSFRVPIPWIFINDLSGLVISSIDVIDPIYRIAPMDTDVRAVYAAERSVELKRRRVTGSVASVVAG